MGEERTGEGRREGREEIERQRKTDTSYLNICTAGFICYKVVLCVCV